MKRFFVLFFVGVGLRNGTLMSHEMIVAKALESHQVWYGSASQLNKEVLSDLFLAQDFKDKRRVQIKSLNQFTTGDNSELRGASCGFHALRNGIVCALSLINKDGKRSALKSLSSSEHANELFGTKFSPWRLEIGKMRNESTARKIGREIIFAALNLKKEGSDKHFDLLMSCIGSMILPMFAQPEICEDGFHYSASKKEIYDALTKRAHAITGRNGWPIDEKGTLDSYFTKDLTLDFMIDFEGNCYRVTSPFKIQAKVSHDIDGNWVQSDEMAFLIDSQRSNEGVLAKEPTLLVATYGEDLGGIEQHAFASEKFMQLYALLRETKHDCVGVVLVYLPGGYSVRSYSSSAAQKVYSWIESWLSSDQSNTNFSEDAQGLQMGQDNGHWISLVVSRIKGDLRYYILDSCNVNRLRNVRINQIIDMFDGVKDLPGYDWTAEQITKLHGHAITKTADSRKGYSWTKIGLGGAVVGLLTYSAYYFYSQHKNKNNS